jgi:hypothetical protein
MRMRPHALRLWAVTALALCSALATAPPSSAASNARPCHVKHARAVLAAGHVRAFTVARHNSSGHRVRVTYACLAPHGRIHRLDNPTVGKAPTFARRILARGTAVGWVLGTKINGILDHDTANSLELQSGRRRECSVSLQGDVGGYALDFALGRAGAIVSIGQDASFHSHQVQLRESSGPSTGCTTVATGTAPSLNPGSLAVSADGLRFYWTSDGHPRSADFR